MADLVYLWDDGVQYKYVCAVPIILYCVFRINPECDSCLLSDSICVLILSQLDFTWIFTNYTNDNDDDNDNNNYSNYSNN